MKWEQYIDTYLFADNYGTYLVDFLEKYLYGDSDSDKFSDSDKLDRFFAMYEKWKSEYLVCSKIFDIESTRAWYINFGFFKFSLPSNKAYHVEEWIEKIAILSLEFECDLEGVIRKEYYYQNCYPPYEVFKQEFFDAFNYAKEKCAKLTVLEAVDELQSIYNPSIKRFQSEIKDGIHYNGMDRIKNNYSIFHSIIGFFETLQDETVIRLNSSIDDEYLWYFVKTDSNFYVLRISDFA